MTVAAAALVPGVRIRMAGIEPPYSAPTYVDARRTIAMVGIHAVGERQQERHRDRRRDARQRAAQDAPRDAGECGRDDRVRRRSKIQAPGG